MAASKAVIIERKGKGAEKESYRDMAENDMPSVQLQIGVHTDLVRDLSGSDRSSELPLIRSAAKRS